MILFNYIFYRMDDQNNINGLYYGCAKSEDLMEPTASYNLEDNDINSPKDCMNLLYKKCCDEDNKLNCGFMLYRGDDEDDEIPKGCHQYNDVTFMTSSDTLSTFQETRDLCGNNEDENKIYLIADYENNAEQEVIKRKMENELKEYEDNLKEDKARVSDLQATLAVLNDNDGFKSLNDPNLQNELEKKQKELEAEKLSKEMAKEFKEAERVSMFQSIFDKLSGIIGNVDKNTGRLINNKSKISKKIDEDIDLLNWSIKQNNEKDAIYNKIKSLLTILIIVLSLVSFISLIYMVLPKRYLNNLKNKSSNVLDNVLTPKKIKPTKNEINLFNEIFN